jgi:hypothetical protein
VPSKQVRHLNSYEHNSLALIVFRSSPVLRKGSILNLAPCSSPTPISASDVELLRTKSGSTDVRRSGGGSWALTDGILFLIVEYVPDISGFSGLSRCIFRWSSAVGCSFALPGPASRRGVVDRHRPKAIDGSADRNTCLTKAMIRNIDVGLSF